LNLDEVLNKQNNNNNLAEELPFANAHNEISGMENFFATSIEDYNDFDKQAWAKGKGYSIPSFSGIEKNLEGLESGLFLLAAESNVGKSALMMNLIYDISMHKPNKLFGIYYSLDDAKFAIVPRIIAMDKLVPISVVSKPSRYKELIDNGAENSVLYQEWLNKRTQGLIDLKTSSNAFKIEDSSRIKSSDDLLKHMKQVQVFVQSIDPEANIVVAIDSINDIHLSQPTSSIKEKHDIIAKMVKHWAVTELNIPIFSSIHLRKLNQARRPILDDLKESVEYVYEASIVWLLYSDVGKNKNNAKIYSAIEGSEELGPVIEMDWAKNKMSSYKGRTFCYFSPEYSKAQECGEETSRRFNSLIYEG